MTTAIRSASSTHLRLRASVLAISQLFLSGAAVLAHAPASAQAAASAQARTAHDIAAGPLDTALTRFGRTAGIMLSFPTAMTDGLQTPGLHGSYTVQEALTLLLQGTGLEGVQDGTLVVIRRQATPPLRAEAGAGAGATADYSMREIRVTGRRDGETEGSGSYATPVTTIGKTAQALRELPQAVSEIGRAHV